MTPRAILAFSALLVLVFQCISFVAVVVMSGRGDECNAATGGGIHSVPLSLEKGCGLLHRKWSIEMSVYSSDYAASRFSVKESCKLMEVVTR